MKKVRFPFLDLSDVNRNYIEALRSAATRVVDSGRYIGGPEVELFEKDLASQCHAPYAIGVSTGLDALRLILSAWIEMGMLKKDDGVIVPGNTFIASLLAIVHAGLRPVIVDPDPATFCLSAQGIEQACRTTDGIKAVMPVHLYGNVAWNEEIARVVADNRLLVIEDTAQAIGAIAPSQGLFGSDRAGALGHAGAFSFYPTKNIGALGDAGAVVAHDATLATVIRQLANYGSDRRYHNIYAGFNCRLDPIQAAMIRAKLPDTLSANSRRFARAVAYGNEIRNPLVITPRISPNVTDQVWHQYVIRVRNGHRNQLKEYLACEGVETDIHYPIPPHLQPCFSHLPHQPLPVSEQLAEEVLSLPISDTTSVADAAEIARIINRFNP